jgi:P4 family phage/plasmid primase-like protien
MEFREGRPDDYVSFTTGINYVPYVEDHPIMQDIVRFWNSVHPDAGIREYVLMTLASCLSGRIREERFHIWTGSGCHAPGTQIMMLDGATKAVEDVRVGDVLMGDDSTPRNVLQLFQGRADMWRVVPAKGESFVVNGDHVLSLVATKTFGVNNRSCRPTKPYHSHWFDRSDTIVMQKRCKAFVTEEEARQHIEYLAKSSPTFVHDGDVIDVTVKDYLANVKRFGSRNLYLHRPDFVEFAPKPIDDRLHPYNLGVWLGDGTTTARAESYNVSKADGIGGMEKNDFSKALLKYGLIGNKHVPLEYLCNTREVRMQVLAGIIDTDGDYQEHTNQLSLTQKSERLFDDILSLARSLGFACYKSNIQKKCCNNGVIGTYFRMQIVGKGIEDIPLQLTRKHPRERTKNKNVNRVSFSIDRVEDGEFRGFELDANHRYLTGDCVVHHNSNGKSLTVTLFEKALGEYCCKFPITLMTQKRTASSSATPEIARAKGRRFAVLQEPSEDERLNVGQLKELSGGDVVQTRELFKAPCEWRPQFKLFLLCNQLPHVPSDDGGTWRRIRVVEFGSKFVDNPSPDNPNEYPVDVELSSRIDSWKEHFMALLVNRYKVYLTAPLREPEAVMACTREYQRTNDHLADFVDSCIERVPVSTQSTTDGDGTGGACDGALMCLDAAFSSYKEWAKQENVPALQQRIKKIVLQKYLERYIGKPTTVSPNGMKSTSANSWKGVRLVNRWSGSSELSGF